MAEAPPPGRRILFSAQKNEAPFLLEWVAFHKVVGFTDIVVYSNDCTDGSDDLLDSLAAAGEIVHRRHEVPQGVSPQLNAGQLFLDSGYLRPGDWVMWLDTDEYLCVNAGGRRVDDLLAALPDAAAIGVAWRVFGDSHRPWAGRQISSAYVMASRRAFMPNLQVKTLFRFDDRIRGLELHRPLLAETATPENYRFYHSGGGRVPDVFFDRVFRSGAPAHRLVGVAARYRLAQVNHYTVRSRDLFDLKKRRGNGYVARGTTAAFHEQHQQDEYFERYNRNDTPDRAILSYAVQTFERTERLRTHARAREAGADPPQGGRAVPVWWYDGTRNFGDEIGPWLVSAIARRPVVRAETADRPVLSTVGSILTMGPRGGSIVWGSGCLRPVDHEVRAKLRRRMPFDVRAVRGALTHRALAEALGLDAPQVFGDPALLLPRFLSPPAPAHGRIAVCPHYSHTELFRAALTEETARFEIVDVADPMEQVVGQIAGASHCLSTSLHGVIVAQAYEVPWVWLRMADSPLSGGDFKFEDFFTVLDRAAVASDTLPAADLGAARLLRSAATATLPAARFAADDLLAAFPFDAV